MSSHAVEVKNLTVQFGKFKAVDGISFTVEKGEIFGFLGANGAGKTTTIRVLCGLLEPSGGEAVVAGLNLKEGLTRVKERVGYMSQKFTLYQDLTVEENLEFAAALHRIPRKDFLRRRQELLDFIGFKAGEKSLVSTLSGGTKQEVSLVASLLHDPEIVFLDEPTAGVSPAFRARFWSLIRSLANAGKTLFVTTHYMDEAEHCGRIALMSEGHIIALDSPAELKKKAFPEYLFEVTPLTKSALWLNRLQGEKSVLGIKPYGMRYHAIIRDEKAWLETAGRMSGDFTTRPIAPSLEDVFIRLVEGK